MSRFFIKIIFFTHLLILCNIQMRRREKLKKYLDLLVPLCHWIINKETKDVYGGCAKEEFDLMSKKLEIPQELKFLN